MKQSHCKKTTLYSIYRHFYLTNISLLIISLLGICSYILFSNYANMGRSVEVFSNYYLDILFNYRFEAKETVRIFIMILTVITVTYDIYYNARVFDDSFVVSYGKYRVYLAKIKAKVTVVGLLVVMMFVSHVLIDQYHFRLENAFLEATSIFAFLMLEACCFLMLSEFIVNFIGNYFSSVILLILFWLPRLISYENPEIADRFEYVIPIVNENYSNIHYLAIYLVSMFFINSLLFSFKRK